MYRSAHMTIESAVASGWIGSSAVSMQAALDNMRDSRSRIVGRLDEHSQGLMISATSYQEADARG
ncbi:WXG100 family type VII secretion target [Gordonia sp. DT30]|uniref:WXG100 family type VII secretion target n=1 Tax=unclassified Gordonia (in: high G+C Gram-positive bacteria) TaxID=2657482 RepID=UPI003CF1E12D